jgi:hypothetical protein
MHDHTRWTIEPSLGEEGAMTAGASLLHVADFFSDCAHAAYTDRLHRFELWEPADLVPFKGERFSGYVAADANCIVVTFRGTQNALRPAEAFIAMTQEWLRNLNYRQVPSEFGRVHVGFAQEWNSVASMVDRLVRRELALAERPVFLTGHSAGAAVAMVAGERLARAGRRVDGVYVFASPRVGDAAFRDSYPVRLLRFERGRDIVPWVPFSPKMAMLGGRLLGVDALLRFLDRWMPAARLQEYASDAIEYYHAGELVYLRDDSDEAFHVRRQEDTTALELLRSGLDVLAAALGGSERLRDIGHQTLVTMRLGDLVGCIANHAKSADEDPGFFSHHNIATMKGLVRRLIAPA